MPLWEQRTCSDEKAALLDLNCILEEQGAERESLLAAHRTVEQHPLMAPFNDVDEEKMEVAVPETAHQISSGSSFFVFVFPFCFSDVGLSLSAICFDGVFLSVVS